MKNTWIPGAAFCMAIALFSCKQNAAPSGESEEQLVQDDTKMTNPGRIQWGKHTLDVTKIVTGSTSLLAIMDRSGKDILKAEHAVAPTAELKQLAALDSNADGQPLFFLLIEDQDATDDLVAYEAIGDKLERTYVPALPDQLESQRLPGDSIYAGENVLYRVIQLDNGSGTPFTATVLYEADPESGELMLREQR